MDYRSVTIGGRNRLTGHRSVKCQSGYREITHPTRLLIALHRLTLLYLYKGSQLLDE